MDAVAPKNGMAICFAVCFQRSYIIFARSDFPVESGPHTVRTQYSKRNIYKILLGISLFASIQSLELRSSICMISVVCVYLSIAPRKLVRDFFETTTVVRKYWIFGGGRSITFISLSAWVSVRMFWDLQDFYSSLNAIYKAYFGRKFKYLRLR